MPRLITAFAVVSMLGILVVAQESEKPKELVSSFSGHSETVYGVAISPDGKQLLTASFDRTVKLWDLASGKELRTFGGEKGHQNLVLAVAFAPDGQTFASAGSDNAVKVWDVPLAKPLRELALADAVTVTALSADGKSAAAGGRDGIIKILNPANGKELFALKGHVGAVTGLAYAPNNPQSLASVGVDGTLRFWNLADGKPVAITVAHAKPATAVTFSTGSNAVYTCAEDGTVKFWQVPPVAAKSLAGHTDTVRALAVSSDGTLAATGCADKNVRVFNTDNGQLMRTLPTPQPIISTAITQPGGNAMTIAGLANGQVIAWAKEDKPLFQSQVHTGEVTAIAFGPSGTQFATVGADGNLAVWAMPIVLGRTIAQPADAKSLSITPDGKRAVTFGADNQVRVWDLRSGQAEKTIPANATQFAVSVDGSAFAFLAADNIVRWQKRDSGTPTQLPNQTNITALALHPNGSQLLAAHSDGNLKLWNVPFPAKDAKPVWESKLAGVKRVLFEPNGNRFFAIAADKTLHVLDSKTGKETPSTPIHEAALIEAVVSPDGIRVVTSSEDKSVLIRTLADGKNVAKIALSAPAVRIAVSPRGDKVAIAHPQDGKIAVSVYEAATSRKLLTFDDRFAAVTGLNFDPASRALIIAGDKSLAVVDVPVTNILPVHAGGATGVVFHPNNAIFTCGKDKTVKQWDIATGKETKTIATLPDVPNVIALSRDGAQLAVASGKNAKLWNLADGKELVTLAHPAEVISLGFNPDRTRLVTGTTDNLARVWDLAKNQELQAFGHGAAVHGVAFPLNKPNVVVTASADKTAMIHPITITRYVAVSPQPLRSVVAATSGAHLILGGDDKTVRLLNLNNGEVERKFEGAGGPILAVAQSRNGNVVAASGADKIVRLYNFADGNLIGQFTTTGPVRSLAFHPSNTALVSAAGNVATMWNVGFTPGNPPPPEFGKPIQSFEHPTPVSSLVLNVDGTSMISGSDDKLARVWRVAADGPTKNFAHPNIVDAIAYNKEGTLLASACHDGIVRIHDVAKAAVLKTINAHTMPQASPVYCIVWSPDGKQLATGSLDKSIKIWDATAGTLVKEIKGFDEKMFPKGHSDGVYSVAFTPDGKQIVSGSSDRTIKMWNVADGAFVREFVNPAFPTSPMQPSVCHPGAVYHLRFTPGGQIVSVGGAPRGRGFVALWNSADGKLLHGSELALGPFFHVAAIDGSQFVIACGPRVRGAPEASAVIVKLQGK